MDYTAWLCPKPFASGAIEKAISRGVVPAVRACPPIGSDRGGRDLNLFVRRHGGDGTLEAFA